MTYAPLSRKTESAAPAPKSTGLRIGEPDDSFEQEADHVAEEVMAGGRLQWSLSRTGASALLRRKCACGGPEECEECKEKKILQRKADGAAGVGYAPAIVDDVLRSSGRPLDPVTRDFMEPRFGYDFSRVRIHTDTKAAQSARSVDARAYTVGNHIVFADGRFRPSAPEGRRLLAHELAHVAQPGGSSAPVRRQKAPGFSVARGDFELVLMGYSCPGCHDKGHKVAIRKITTTDELLAWAAELAYQGRSVDSLINELQSSAFEASVEDRQKAVKLLQASRTDIVEYAGFRHLGEEELARKEHAVDVVWTFMSRDPALVKKTTCGGLFGERVILSLLMRHEDSKVHAFWESYRTRIIASGDPSGAILKDSRRWAEVVTELDKRAVDRLVQEIKDTMQSPHAVKAAYLETDPKKVVAIEDNPRKERVHLPAGDISPNFGVTACDKWSQKRFVSTASYGALDFEVTGHEGIYFELPYEYAFKTMNVYLGKDFKGFNTFFADLWDAVGKLTKGVITVVTSPVTMIIDTLAKIIDMTSQAGAMAGWWQGYTCLSSTCKQAEACLKHESFDKCQSDALHEAVESATIIMPLYRQGRACIGGDLEACGAMAPILLGLVPKGGRALRGVEEPLRGAAKGAAELKEGEVERPAASGVEPGKPLSKSEYESAAVREVIDRRRPGDPDFSSLEEPKASGKPEPSKPKPPAKPPKRTAPRDLAKLESQVERFAARQHPRIKLSQAHAEIEQMYDNAKDPAKVRKPGTGDYDAEIETSVDGDKHLHKRVRNTRTWCRFSPVPPGCGEPVGEGLDQEVDAAPGEGGRAPVPPEPAGAEPPHVEGQPPRPPAGESGGGGGAQPTNAPRSTKASKGLGSGTPGNRVASAKALGAKEAAATQGRAAVARGGFWRGKPVIQGGNANEGWAHIDARHVTGNAPEGAGDLFAPGTTRAQLQNAAEAIVDRGVRISDPSRRLQTFERRITINGNSDTVRVVVDTADGRVITMFPVRGGG